ncbi:MAG: M20/M25/M40 family metallo-hydrolase [Tannerellaceae bacterium]|nr:M20/M25/M40 family metallo-hydrolase [Tannerellaceae bacterium]
MNLKTMIGILVVLILVLAGILIVKTVTYPFLKTEKQSSHSAIAIPLISNEALERFAGGIRIPTISAEVYENTNFEPFDRFKAYLPEAYPAIYEAMDTLTINTYGLVFHWKGKNASKKPILFLSHYDVVPVIGYEDDNEEYLPVDIIFQPEDTPAPSSSTIHTSWDYPPFSGAIARGNVYGRGTLDMKCMLFSILEAADALLAEGFQPEQDIWFAFGHDEEVGGRQGALQIAAYFKEQNITFDAVYDEGGIIAAPGSALETIDRPVALVGPR